MESLLEQGRSASPGELTRRLPSAGPAYLEGALENRQLTTIHLLQLLRNPRITPALIDQIAQNRTWLRPYKVRAALAVHPRTPRMTGVLLLSSLGWRDLASVAEGPRIAPQVRRMAELRLTICMEEMAQGERISLARMAGRGMIAALCEDESARVIAALLQNPRLLENDVLRLVSRLSAPGAVLRTVAHSDRFGHRREVQKGIVRHPNTPAPVALRLLQDLGRADLREILRAPRLPRLIEVAACRLLQGAPGSPERRQSRHKPRRTGRSPT
jgi:hypothetical protein